MILRSCFNVSLTPGVDIKYNIYIWTECRFHNIKFLFPNTQEFPQFSLRTCVPQTFLTRSIVYYTFLSIFHELEKEEKKKKNSHCLAHVHLCDDEIFATVFVMCLNACYKCKCAIESLKIPPNLSYHEPILTHTRLVNILNVSYTYGIRFFSWFSLLFGNHSIIPIIFVWVHLCPTPRTWWIKWRNLFCHFFCYFVF